MIRDSIRIIDRKKEIYKNISGQTIAPQKIENLFRDFDSVGRIFLVGDHRAYNTALIYANPEDEALDLEALSPEDLKSHFRSLVVSANSFLAPFERIVDFAVIDRDFDAEQGELTAKGTFRRKTIERTFADEIRLLYRRRKLTVGGRRCHRTQLAVPGPRHHHPGAPNRGRRIVALIPWHFADDSGTRERMSCVSGRPSTNPAVAPSISGTCSPHRCSGSATTSW